ncbi:bud site selection protein Rax2p [Monosporozyma servazzii]
MLGSMLLSQLLALIAISGYVTGQDTPQYNSSETSSLSHLSELSRHFNISTIPEYSFSSSSQDNNFEILNSVHDLTFVRYSGQQNFTQLNIYNDDANYLIYTSNNTFIQLIENGPDTYISNIVPFQDDCFLFNGQGSLNTDSNLNNQILYNLSDASIKSLFDQPLDTVKSILTDNDAVYFGGNFTLDSDSINSVIKWNSTSGENYTLPFKGFGSNSHINSIIKLDNDNILFAGQFNTLNDKSFLNTTNASNNSFPFNPIIPLDYATWDTSSGSVSADSLTCSVSSSTDGWSANGIDNQLKCTIPFDVTPSKIRIYNSNNNDTAVSLFRILTYPAGSIMNMTYIDPISGKLSQCDAFCPLYVTSVLEASVKNQTSTSQLINNNRTRLEFGSNFQEFSFVNPVSVSSIELMTLASFGNQDVSLEGLQLYQASYSVFANNTFNEQLCDSDSHKQVASSTISSNNWFSNNTNTYLSTNYIPNSGSVVPEINYDVDIQDKGTYSVNIFTPGCLLDNTCSSRGIVNVTVIDKTTDEVLSSKLIYQNNNEMKYDNIYQGRIDHPCRIELKYSSGLFSSNTMTTVVADRVDVNIMSLDDSTLDDELIQLNGIFQYQISNFTNNDIKNPIGLTSLNMLASRLSNNDNGDFTASLYDDSTLVVSDPQDSIYIVDLNDKLDVDNVSQLNVSSNIIGHHIFSGGIVFLAEDSNEVYVYNGTLTSLPITNETTIYSVSNITLFDTEFLIFNENVVYNVTSASFLNSSESSFEILLQSSAQNSVEDTLFFGKFAFVDYASINDPVTVSGMDSTVQGLELSHHIQPYKALYFNDSQTGYFYYDDNLSKITFTSEVSNDLQWGGAVSTTLYDNENRMLFVAQSGSSNSSAAISLIDLSSFKILQDFKLGQNEKIESLLDFPKNKSLLVGGSFTTSQNNCSNLCVLDYDGNKWNTFLNGSINITVDKLGVFQQDSIVVLGSNSSGHTQLLSINMTSYNVEDLLTESNGLNNFILNNGSIIAWNDTVIYSLSDRSLSSIYLPNSDANSTISSIEAIKVNDKDDGLLVLGEFSDIEYGPVQAMLYYGKQWIPYMYLSTNGSTPNLSSLQLFVNKDISPFMISQFPLPNMNETTSTTSTIGSKPTTSNTSNPRTTKNPGKHEEKKIHRGFIVLIGLALALVTVSVFGLVGILLAYIFKDSSSGNYQAVNPIIDENEMIDTLPPQKIMNLM